ncbi:MULTISPECIES: hypothetical protein [Herbaspirillum]|uniref:hypothetical protein n=1 Tax=Herbaspirillum TaxID=963 RepID=UPI001AC7E923|nr:MULTISPECIES: hypothetical protein [Herbaspirillum]MBN9357518.1 hypothetical protein [Herbaspirillum huttiense]
MSAASIERLHDQVMHAKNFIRRFRFPQHLAGAILALSAAHAHAQALTIGVTPGVIKRLYSLPWQKP